MEGVYILSDPMAVCTISDPIRSRVVVQKSSLPTSPHSARRTPLLTSLQFAYDWAVSLAFPLGPITNCEAAGVWDQVVQARQGTKVRFSFSFLSFFLIYFFFAFLYFLFPSLFYLFIPFNLFVSLFYYFCFLCSLAGLYNVYLFSFLFYIYIFSFFSCDFFSFNFSYLFFTNTSDRNSR
jgi:hypothetical protein